MYFPQCQAIPLRVLKPQISQKQHSPTQDFFQYIQIKRDLPAVAMPLMLCVILEDFTIDEIPEEDKNMQYDKDLLFTPLHDISLKKGCEHVLALYFLCYCVGFLILHIQSIITPYLMP